ncbi:hypothetical protein Pcinc_018036 [Petrolisthes cinctipes]|uniref:Uncharacterized protein n=1 Tax=Petrolisthes cinctipes TaxID=88211 RepID=A0AAE1KJR9_PETCI|nr:hypothetical protein Pcinc_018036 [Petrolisthes cinctipes]
MMASWQEVMAPKIRVRSLRCLITALKELENYVGACEVCGDLVVRPPLFKVDKTEQNLRWCTHWPRCAALRRRAGDVISRSPRSLTGSRHWYMGAVHTILPS